MSNEQFVTQVQVKNVWAPSQPGYSARIQAIDGQYYNIPDVAMGAVNQGGVHDITFHVYTSKAGKQSNIVDLIDGQPLPTSNQPRPVQHAAQTPVQAAPVQPSAAAAPHVPFTPTGPAHQADTAEDIFVTGVVGRSMGSGQFSITDIPLLTDAAVTAWRNRGAQINDGYLGRTTTDEPPWPDAPPPHEEYPR